MCILQLSTSDVSHLKNKSAYLIGLIKTHKKKSGVTNSDSTMYAAAPQQQEAAIDPSQVKITYSKYYTGKDLGPCDADKVKVCLKSKIECALLIGGFTLQVIFSHS